MYQFRINKHIQAVLGVQSHTITPDKTLNVDFGADSLDVIELEHNLENEFNITLRISDKMTVQDVYDAVTAAISQE